LGSLLTILGLFVRPCFKKRKPERVCFILLEVPQC
jgi:hypothetical protein